MTGACVNFKPVGSALQAVAHASRAVAPSYLLSPEFSLGTIVVVDDKNNVAETLEKKLSMASRQAKREKNFSPLWEGVINLERPVIDLNFDAVSYKKRCVDAVEKWAVDYEKLTGHKVLRSDIHLDEGMVEDGEGKLNAHAHVIVDRTNEKGRVMKLSRTELQHVQTLTAKATGLPRGESATGGRRHIDHQTYKLLKEQAKEKAKSNEEVAVAEVQSELEKLKEAYAADRAALKASGAALQSDYQKLKERYEAFKIKAHAAVDQGNLIIANLSKENETMKTELQTASARDHQRLAAEAAPVAQEIDLEIDLEACQALQERFGADKEADKGDLEDGRVAGAVSGLVVLHIGRGVHVFHKLPAGSPLPAVGKPLNERQREGINR